MLSIEARKLILKLILSFLYMNHVNGCDSNKQLYAEIGCKPIYDDISKSCPVAYNCEHVFSRPKDKCYFNGNAYEPKAMLSVSDSALNPCLASCFCNQHTNDNKTITKFVCADVECPSYFISITEPCYLQYDKNLCCEVKTYCPEEKAIVHECNFNGDVYKHGQQIFINDDLKCICSPEFNGTFNDKSCTKISCKYEILSMENILKRSAPVYFEKVNGCPIEWYNSEYDAVSEVTPPTQSRSYQCKYGDRSFSIGQNFTISDQSDSESYSTTCSCNIPPFVTCIKIRKPSM